MLLNLTHVPSSQWSEKQKKIALDEFESIKDVSLPPADIEINESNVRDFVEERIQECVIYFSNADRHNAVCIKADDIYTFCFVNRLLKKGFRCINPLFSSNGDEFIKFREYKVNY